MAQAEDTELRDLVIEALEKNGSLAKVRALLRANVFLAFENECENVKQNVSLDNILQLPEGVLCLSLIHEFLEFCNLKNTLFVYMSESRQGNEYKYEGRKILTEKFNISAIHNNKEPVLVTLLKSILKLYPKKCNKDDQNCTYIVHDETSGSTSNSQSDNSSDERNKLHLRLNLDNSDTDTSSDSARDKSSSEYIPNEHILCRSSDNMTSHKNELELQTELEQQKGEDSNVYNVDKDTKILDNINPINNSSSESTSYINLKPFNALEKKLMNTAGVPFEESDKKEISTAIIQSGPILQAEFQQGNNSKTDSVISPATLSGVSSISLKKDDIKYDCIKATALEESVKSDVTMEYTYDFTSSVVKDGEIKDTEALSPPSIQEDLIKSPNKNSSIENYQQHSPSSQSSISISDVADLISEKSSSNMQHMNPKNISLDKADSSNSPKINTADYNKHTDDSGDFSDSPIPSLSNLSLDIHSD